jgi:NAD(P)H-quinone oxidoreductase subunit 5
MEFSDYIPGLTAWLLATVPVVLAGAALIVPAVKKTERMWGSAFLVSGWLFMPVVSALAVAFSYGSAVIKPLGFNGMLSDILAVRVNTLSLAMIVLITFISLVIIRYAATYLQGDPRQPYFIRWHFATVANVSILVMSDHLLVMVAAWIGASLSIHGLLTYFKERPQAVLAAHKKFLISRIADLCLLGGVIVLWMHGASWRVETVLLQADAGLSPFQSLGAVLIACAAILQCAQLPFHGWLMQVMEAPTPVSALLHAGVVNVSGFLLILMAPIVSQQAVAQWLLVIVGGATALVAGLIMMTRVSVKVQLAWSTSAQMGFMLLECGLGAYALALLHLLAHSLYKAHCFLQSGNSVKDCVQGQMVSRPQAYRVQTWLVSLAAACVLVCLTGFLFGVSPDEEPALWALAGILSAGVAVFLGEAISHSWRDGLLRVVSGAFIISILYFSWHKLLLTYGGLSVAMAQPVAGTIVFALVCFSLQYVIFIAEKVNPGHPRLRLFQAYLFHGLYLDELFTRVTLLVWPPRISRKTGSQQEFALTDKPSEVPS